jgi:hypothetical protein
LPIRLLRQEARISPAQGLRNVCLKVVNHDKRLARRLFLHVVSWYAVTTRYAITLQPGAQRFSERGRGCP